MVKKMMTEFKRDLIGGQIMQIDLKERKDAVIEGNHSKNITNINYGEFSDENLVKAFVDDRKEEAFNEIVNRYADKVFRLALRITHNPHDAEEVLQEVFLSMEKLGTFREESKFSTWLYRVAINAGYMHLRNERKYKNNVSLESDMPYSDNGVLEGTELNDLSNRPDELFLTHEGMETIETAVNQLPLPYRIVFHLRDVEGLTNQEVAKSLGLSLPAVKSRILRARLFLRDRLSDYFYEWRK
ncbi:MAG: sigma-70 family RNA polymerase sigma factor [Candidatus Dadabacteria bacterium]|nr:sigma-70 family RNA polymerase sigma factor [Candidatus Dadabacteria bacterium]